MARLEPIDCTKIAPAQKPIDAEGITRQLESGRATLLVEAMCKANTIVEAKDILNAMQGINALHRLNEPARDLPTIVVTEREVGLAAKASRRLTLDSLGSGRYPIQLYEDEFGRGILAKYREIKAKME